MADDTKPEPKAPETAEEEAEQTPERPADAFKAGLGLLWKAARGAASEIKHEVEKGGVSDALQKAGHELETAAQQVGKALDDFVHRAGGGVKPDYSDKWPPDEHASAKPAGESDPEADQVGGSPDDGGKTPDGTRRDMRIQLEDDNGGTGNGGTGGKR